MHINPLSLLLLFLLQTLRTVAQGPVSISQPLAGTTWQSGQPEIIAWSTARTPILPQIALVQGSPQALRFVRVIATNVPASPMQYSWTVDSSLPSGDDYAIAIGVSPDISYIGPIKIVHGDSRDSLSSTSSPTSNNSPTETLTESPTNTGKSTSTLTSTRYNNYKDTTNSRTQLQTSTATTTELPTSKGKFESRESAGVKRSISGGMWGLGIVCGVVAFLSAL
jgi:hypothetical protein